jgi:predicted MPP superfamily phosphohydrolase
MQRRLKRIFLFLIALAIVFLVYAHFETYWIQVVQTTVSSRELPAEFSGKKIVYIADIHCGDDFEPARLGKVVNQINSLKPDIVLLGGDYVNRNGQYTAACFAEMAKIEAPLGKFGILGNHDIEARTESVENAMRTTGITPLVKENRKITIGKEEITIAGTDETWYGNPDGAKAMENATPFVIYLTHDPWYLEQYRPAAQLLLAGHTHGGQVTLFGIPFANLAHWRNYKYQKGIFFENGQTIIVTNGIGATILPLRFFARPQINLITLERSN